MILHATELSPSQKAMIEELMGRELADADAIGLRLFSAESIPEEQRQAARDRLLAFLRSERPKPTVSDEEFESAYLEAMRSVRPGYTEIR